MVNLTCPRAILALVLPAVVSLMSACAAAAVSSPSTALSTPVDPGALVRKLAIGADSSNPYRDPTSAELRAARGAVRSLLAGPGDLTFHAPIFRDLGFEMISGEDPVTKRPYLLYLADPSTARSWGAVLLDVSTRPDLVIEVPHTGFDAYTEVLGVEAFRARAGSLLLVAGAHRQAAGGLADVAHNDRSLFHAMATELAAAGLPEVQLHGFADANLPDADIAVSTGLAPVGRAARKIGKQLASDGFLVCLAWEQTCGRLEGTTNVQGQAAAEKSTVFVHIEASWKVRSDEELRGRLVRSIVAAVS